MSSLNKVMIIGNLGQDPDVRYTQSGDAVATLSVATTSRWKDSDTGEMKEKTEWHRVVMWRRLAEIAGEFLKKGSQVYIEGALETRKWQDQDGNDRYTTEIKAMQMQMLGSKDGSRGGSQKPPQERRKQPDQPAGDLDFDDDIPF